MIDPQRAREELGDLVARSLTDEDVRDRYARLVWNTLTEPGDRAAGRLIDGLGPSEALARVQRQDIGDILEGAERGAALGRWQPRLRPGIVSAVLRTARAAHVRLLTPGDEAWPLALADLGDHAPLVLWVRGSLPVLPAVGDDGVAIVGARAATGYGEHVAGEMAAELAASGISIVSGAAFGIDAAAHRATLAGGGTTIALMAGGLERAYPQAHAQLIDRIAQTGAVVSEVPPGSAPTKWRFLQRNRLIAALSAATVVVEAGWRSGSLNTAHHASALGRPIGAVPGPVTSAASAGCHRLLRELEATCVTNAADVRELLGWGEPAPGETGAASPYTSDHTRVRDALSSRSTRTPEEIARRSGLSVTDVHSHLGLLRLDGAVSTDGMGWRLT